VSDEIAHLPAWVRRRDGSQVPFEADHICQSLYSAAESLGAASPFLIRELTDAVLHFLAQETFDSIPSTAQIAEQTEKIIREIGQPSLARRYAELQRQQKTVPDPARKRITVACSDSPEFFVRDCLEAYALDTLFSRDVAAAIREGLLHIGGLTAPAGLASLVLETPRLAELPWWLALDDWRTCGGERWIVESPEWLCTRAAHPALTPHLCERLLSLPILGQRPIELHLNIAEPPAWSLAHPAPPLFTPAEEETTLQERSNFLDGLLERWKTLDAPQIPALAWHLQERSFRDESQRRQLYDLLRQALQANPQGGMPTPSALGNQANDLGRGHGTRHAQGGMPTPSALGTQANELERGHGAAHATRKPHKAIRFLFDRPRAPIALAEGIDRKCPGVLLEVGVDLAALAQRPDVSRDGATLLKKLPSLARMAVSAALQKRNYLRRQSETSPLKRRFLIERSSAAIVPLGLDEAAACSTGESLAQSPLCLEFALRILQTLKDTLHDAGRPINLDLRLDSSSLPAPLGVTIAPQRQVEIAGKLHARAGAGAMTVLLADEATANIEDLMDLLQWAWASTSVVRLQLQRAGSNLQQGELAI
jgi:hypothetical protein